MGEAFVRADVYPLCMDTSGARSLAARIAAAVRAGSVIELVADHGDELRVGDRGTVRAADPNGVVHVSWERGFDLAISSSETPFRVVSR